MWLNVTEAELTMKQCWAAVFPHNMVCGVAGGWRSEAYMQGFKLPQAKTKGLM